MSLSINQPNYTAKYMYTNNNLMKKSSERLSSGKRINSAADDAAGLAIAKKMETLINGLDKGINNTSDMHNLIQTAEGGLQTISDSLLRIREIAVQANSGIYTSDDKALLQHEVNQLVDHINYTAKNAQFNNKNLLDGTFTDQHTASDAHGNGMKVSIGGMSAAQLGMDGFDITGDFDIDTIDKALSAVNQSRASMGASMNRLEFTNEANMTMQINQAQALSRIADADMAKESMNYNKSRILQQYQIFSMKLQMSGMGNIVSLLI